MSEAVDLAQRPRNWQAAAARATRRRFVLTVADDGRVLVRAGWLTRPSKGAPRFAAHAVPGGEQLIGYVQPADPYAYRNAEQLAQLQGWRRAGAWTTAGRQPACEVRRAR